MLLERVRLLRNINTIEVEEEERYAPWQKDNNVQEEKDYYFVLLTHYYEMEMDMAGGCLQRGSSEKAAKK